jgi:hypothetical protein
MRKSVKVWRFETRGGRGMYDVNAFGLATSRQPNPHDDTPLMDDAQRIFGSRYIQNEHHFGFRSIKQMKQWVHRKCWREKLATEGLVLAQYEVPREKIAIGRTQVFFDRTCAKKVAELCPLAKG